MMLIEKDFAHKLWSDPRGKRATRRHGCRRSQGPDLSGLDRPPATGRVGRYHGFVASHALRLEPSRAPGPQGTRPAGELQNQPPLPLLPPVQQSGNPEVLNRRKTEGAEGSHGWTRILTISAWQVFWPTIGARPARRQGGQRSQWADFDRPYILRCLCRLRFKKSDFGATGFNESLPRARLSW